MSLVPNMFTISVILFAVFNGYVVDPRTGHRYKFHPIGATWIRAFISCWSEGGYLTIINSEDEANFVKDLFNRYPTNSVTAIWRDTASIGFYDADENRTWKTIRGDTLLAAGYSRFDDGQPNNTWGKQYCGAIFRNGRLDDFWCDASAPYICEKDPIDTSSNNRCETIAKAGYAKWNNGEPNNVTIFGGEFCDAIKRNWLLNDLDCNGSFVFSCEKDSLICVT